MADQPQPDKCRKDEAQHNARIVAKAMAEACRLYAAAITRAAKRVAECFRQASEKRGA